MIDRHFNHGDFSLPQQSTERFKIPEDFNA
jgi:hypothetical protein